MKNETFPEVARQPASVENALRFAIARRALSATALVPLATLAGAAGGWAIANAYTLPLLPLSASLGFVAGLAAAGFVSKNLSHRLAAVAARPLP